MRTTLLLAATPALIAALAIPAARAEDLTDAELMQLFQAQRDAIAAAGSHDLGAARGLELVTVDDLGTEPDLAPVAGIDAPVAPVAVAASDAPPVIAGPAEPPVVASAATVPSVADGDAPPVVSTASADPTIPGPDVDTEAPGAPIEVAAAGDAPVAPVTAEGVSVGAATETLASAAGADALDLTGAAETAVPTPVVFAVMPPNIQVNLRITFAYDSAVLGDDQLPKLQQLCRVMQASGGRVFRIVGHTDAAGSDLYNERLSLLRAQEVRRWFVSDCGLPADGLEAIGLGERFLADPADPRAGDNRRVEFQALS